MMIVQFSMWALVVMLCIYAISCVVSLAWCVRDRANWKYVTPEWTDWIGMIALAVLPIINMLIPLSIETIFKKDSK